MAHEVFNKVSILGEKFLSVKARGNHSHSIIAYWPKSLEGSNILSDSSCECRAGEVHYFFHHTGCGNDAPRETRISCNSYICICSLV